MKWWLVVTAFLVIMEKEVAGSRILFLTPIVSRSYELFFKAVVKTLASHGHQVTFVSPYQRPNVSKNVRNVIIEDLDTVEELLKEHAGNERSDPSVIYIMESSPELCCDALAKKEVQDLLKEEFDLAIISTFMADCFLSLIYQLKVPHISISPSQMLVTISIMMGNPPFPSFTNFPAYHGSYPFSFAERFHNTIINCVDKYFRDGILRRVDAVCRKRGLCPMEMPSIERMRENASLLLLNSVRTVEVPPRPLMPNIVHIGGIHCKDPKRLPMDLEKWISEAGFAGFILISFGHAIGTPNMPVPYRKLLVEVLSSFPQRVLWKWDQEDIGEIPCNLLLRKKLPIQDLLGDPRLRLFINSGEPLSSMAAMYHGKPLLGLPAFVEQLSVAKEVQRQGWGRYLLWEETDAVILQNNIQGLLVDKNINDEVIRRSVLMHDMPQPPEEVLNYWVDHVIRYKGAPHLRSPILSMSWYEVYNADVWLLMFGFCTSMTYFMVRTCLGILNWCFPLKIKPKED